MDLTAITKPTAATAAIAARTTPIFTNERTRMVLLLDAKSEWTTPCCALPIFFENSRGALPCPYFNLLFSY
jgi:hypothetical protein